MSRYLKTAYQALDAYVPGEQPRDMVYIKLNTNESPFPPAPSVAQAVTKEQIDLLRLYSDPTCKTLKEKLAALYGVKLENVFVGNGSDDVLNFVFMAFGEKGAYFPDLTYGFYTVFSDLHGIAYEQIPLEADFSLDYKAYCGRNKLVVIANPNAPTGLAIPLWQIEEMAKTNPDSVVVIDEAYIDFGGETALPLIETYDNVLIVRTFSKSRSMAGARLGYAFGAPALIADLEKLRFSTNPFNVNRLTMVMAEAALEEEEYYMEKCREIVRVREFTAAALKELGFTVIPSETNFLFVYSDRIGGEAYYQALRKNGILVRHFGNPRIKEYNRITIGTQTDMERLVAVTKSILQEAAYENQ